MRPESRAALDSTSIFPRRTRGGKTSFKEGLCPKRINLQHGERKALFNTNTATMYAAPPRMCSTRTCKECMCTVPFLYRPVKMQNTATPKMCICCYVPPNPQTHRSIVDIERDRNLTWEQRTSKQKRPRLTPHSARPPTQSVPSCRGARSSVRPFGLTDPQHSRTPRPSALNGSELSGSVAGYVRSKATQVQVRSKATQNSTYQRSDGGGPGRCRLLALGRGAGANPYPSCSSCKRQTVSRFTAPRRMLRTESCFSIGGWPCVCTLLQR